jgi:hypothetical protein
VVAGDRANAHHVSPALLQRFSLQGDRDALGGLRGRVGKCNGAIERLTRFGVAPEAAGLPRGTAALAG